MFDEWQGQLPWFREQFAQLRAIDNEHFLEGLLPIKESSDCVDALARQWECEQIKSSPHGRRRLSENGSTLDLTAHQRYDVVLLCSGFQAGHRIGRCPPLGEGRVDVGSQRGLVPMRITPCRSRQG